MAGNCSKPEIQSSTKSTKTKIDSAHFIIIFSNSFMNFPAKRFDYSTSPTSEQLPTFNSKYSFNKPNREHREQNMSEMSPINGRAQMNTSFDNKVKLTAPISSGTKYVPRGGYRAEGGEYQIREYAGRGNQENVCFQNVSL